MIPSLIITGICVVGESVDETNPVDLQVMKGIRYAHLPTQSDSLAESQVSA